MACCKCCCGNQDCTEGQQGKCCCGGAYGQCCQEGEYCCSGVCEPAPCCDGACDEHADCDEGCLCIDGECVAEGACCFKDTSSTYSFTFLTYSGTTSGYWAGPGTEFLMYFCTRDVVVCGSVVGDGVFFRFFDGTDNWEGWLSGLPDTWPCGSGSSLAGSYTLTNCNTSATSTLTIT